MHKLQINMTAYYQICQFNKNLTGTNHLILVVAGVVHEGEGGRHLSSSVNPPTKRPLGTFVCGVTVSMFYEKELFRADNLELHVGMLFMRCEPQMQLIYDAFWKTCTFYITA